MLRINPFGHSPNCSVPIPLVLTYLSKFLPGIEDKSYYAYFTESGRSALSLLLDSLDLSPTDNILIVTTSGGPYISSCVTSTIELFCNWVRTPNANTRASLIIHEFGYICDVPPWVPRNLPVINDFAYCLGTLLGSSISSYSSDYAIFSLPKLFPVSSGGLLLSKSVFVSNSTRSSFAPVSPAKDSSALTLLPLVSKWCQSRQDNFIQMCDLFSRLDLPPFFSSHSSSSVPGAFVLRSTTSKVFSDYNKHYCTSHGIECTQYYGNGGFILPLHQFLDSESLTYIYQTLYNSFESSNYYNNSSTLS